MQRADLAAEQAKREEQNAIKESAKATAVNDFLLKDLLSLIDINNQIDSDLVPDPDIRLSTLLDRASNNIGEKFQYEPDIAASLHHTIGQAYESIGNPQKAERHLRKAIKICREAVGDEHPGTIRAERTLGLFLVRRGRCEEAEPLLASALERCRLIAETLPRYYRLRQRCRVFVLCAGAISQAKPLAIESVDASRKLFGDDSKETLYALDNLAAQFAALGDLQEAEESMTRYFA